WNNEARGVAAVHCVIIGFADHDVPKKRLFMYEDPRSEPIEINARNIAPYLVEGNDVALQNRNKPLQEVPSIGIGNKPIDGGYLLLNDQERKELVKKEPAAEKYIFKWFGA